MQNDDNTDDTQVEIEEGETVAVEETPTEENDTESQSDPVEETPEEKITRLETEKKHFESKANNYLRLLNKSKPRTETPRAPQAASPQVSVEETVLLANGMSEELLSELKAVAGVRKVSLIKAQTDPIFVAVKEKFEKDKKQKDASLPASRGSGGTKPKKEVSSPGLSREEHKRMVLES